MGRYLDIARKVSERQVLPPVSDDGVPEARCEISEISEKTAGHRRLLAAGWEPRVRCGKTIWASPQSGFWYSEEMALELLQLDRGPKGGAA